MDLTSRSAQVFENILPFICLGLMCVQCRIFFFIINFFSISLHLMISKFVVFKIKLTSFFVIKISKTCGLFSYPLVETIYYNETTLGVRFSWDLVAFIVLLHTAPPINFALWNTLITSQTIRLRWRRVTGYYNEEYSATLRQEFNSFIDWHEAISTRISNHWNWKAQKKHSNFCIINTYL